MRSNLLVLLKAQILSHSNMNLLRYEKDKRKKGKIIGTYIALALVFLVISGYCFGMGYAYGYLGMAYLLPEYAVAISSIIVLMFTFFKSNGFLFAFGDYDMLMALPFSIKTLISAKFLYMYVGNLLLTLFVMLPMGVAYGIWEQKGILSYIIWFIITLLTPLLPMTVAAIVGAVITAISSKFKSKVLVESVLTIGLVGASLIGSYSLADKMGMSQTNDLSEVLSSLENSRMKEFGIIIQEALHKIYPVSAWVGTAVQESSLLHMLAFALVSTGIYMVFLIALSKVYKLINTALMTSYQKMHYRMETQKKQSLRKALVFKEFRRFTSSTLYLTNMGIGMIIAIAGSISCMFFPVDTILKELSLTDYRQGIGDSIPFIVGALVCMCCTTSISLSLEGKQYWILQSLPISKKDIYDGKMLFNVILQLPVAIFCCVLLGIAFQAKPLEFVVYLIACVANVGFSTVFGMFIGIKFVNFEWSNEVEVIKQSVACLIGMIGTLLMEIVMAGLVIGLSKWVPGNLMVFGISLVLLGISAGIYGNIVKE